MSKDELVALLKEHLTVHIEIKSGWDHRKQTVKISIKFDGQDIDSSEDYFNVSDDTSGIYGK